MIKRKLDVVHRFFTVLKKEKGKTELEKKIEKDFS